MRLPNISKFFEVFQVYRLFPEIKDTDSFLQGFWFFFLWLVLLIIFQTNYHAEIFLCVKISRITQSKPLPLIFIVIFHNCICWAALIEFREIVLFKILFINILNSHSILLKSVCTQTFDFAFLALPELKYCLHPLMSC